MRDKLAALLLLAFFLLGFISVLRHTYLAWFRTNELTQVIEDSRPKWQKRLPFSKINVESPIHLTILRVSMLIVFLVAVSMLIVIVWIVLLAWLK